MATHPPLTRRLALAVGATGLVCAAEVAGGLLTGSLAFLSDAAHVFLDAFALALSYLALRAASRPPTFHHTYGLHRLQVLAALVNGGTLAAVAVGIFREAAKRLYDPVPVWAGPMLAVAAGGLAVNLAVARLLHDHHRDDLNVHSAFLHVVGDSLNSIGVLGVGVVILLMGWILADPLVSLLIGGVILVGAVRVVAQAVHILVEGVPRGMSAEEVQRRLEGVPGVRGVHDLHVWTVSPGYVALSAHVVVADQALSQAEALTGKFRHLLREEFGIGHATIQVECTGCPEACPGPGCRGPS